MQYRELGNTGKKVSVIGLGCEHLDGKPYEHAQETIAAALAGGVNIFDVFMPGKQVRENVAKALGANRKKVFIQGHIGSTDIKQQYDISRDMPTVKKYFEDLLRIFSYIDYGMMFFIDSEEDYKKVFETEFATYVQQLRQKGDIHHIGFSSHHPEIAVKCIETGLPEMLMFSINPAFDMLPGDAYSLDTLENLETAPLHGVDPARAALYTLCSRRGLGITVMKALGAGKLISAAHTPFAKPFTVPQLIHYSLGRPATGSVLLGCKTAAEVNDALTYFTLSEEELDYTEILSDMRNDFKGSCVYCNHCQPCPAGIDIAAVNKYLDIAKLETANVPPSIHSHYGSLAVGGSGCIACGSCEARCPFAVPVIENMAQAARVFGR